MLVRFVLGKRRWKRGSEGKAIWYQGPVLPTWQNVNNRHFEKTSVHVRKTFD